MLRRPATAPPNSRLSKEVTDVSEEDKIMNEAEETVEETAKEAVSEEAVSEDTQAAPDEPETAEEEKEEKKGSAKKEEKKYKSKCAALEKELGELKGSLEAERDSHLRIAAEYENFRKRTQKEKDAIYSDAVSDTVKILLPLFDDLDRAAEFTSGDNVGEGLALILKSVPDVLSKLRIEAFGEVGETFDPNLHDAMMHEENEELGESVITAVFRKGYKTGDKIIRHALVKVAN